MFLSRQDLRSIRSPHGTQKFLSSRRLIMVVVNKGVNSFFSTDCNVFIAFIGLVQLAPYSRLFIIMLFNIMISIYHIVPNISCLRLTTSSDKQ